MSPAVRERGANGPRRRERENQMKRDWRNWDWKKKREDARKRRENVSEMKINGLFLWKSWGESSVGEDGMARCWKTILGLSSYSSRKSIDTSLYIFI